MFMPSKSQSKNSLTLCIFTMVILLGVYNTTEHFTDSVSLIRRASPVGKCIFICTLHMGQLRHSECQQFALNCQWVDSTACTKLQDLSLKMIHTVHQTTVIFLIYLSAGTEMAPGGLRHYSNFVFKFLKRKTV